eukprot:765378-Hanusia_phi.AAC.5
MRSDQKEGKEARRGEERRGEERRGEDRTRPVNGGHEPVKVFQLRLNVRQQQRISSRSEAHQSLATTHHHVSTYLDKHSDHLRDRSAASHILTQSQQDVYLQTSAGCSRDSAPQAVSTSRSARGAKPISQGSIEGDTQHIYHLWDRTSQFIHAEIEDGQCLEQAESLPSNRTSVSPPTKLMKVSRLAAPANASPHLQTPPTQFRSWVQGDKKTLSGMWLVAESIQRDCACRISIKRIDVLLDHLRTDICSKTEIPPLILLCDRSRRCKRDSWLKVEGKYPESWLLGSWSSDTHGPSVPFVAECTHVTPYHLREEFEQRQVRLQNIQISRATIICSQPSCRDRPLGVNGHGSIEIPQDITIRDGLRGWA